MESRDLLKENIRHQITSDVEIICNKPPVRTQYLRYFTRNQLTAVPRHYQINYQRWGLEMSCYQDSITLMDDLQNSTAAHELANALEMLSAQLAFVLADIERNWLVHVSHLEKAITKAQQQLELYQQENTTKELMIIQQNTFTDLQHLLVSISSYNDLWEIEQERVLTSL